MSSAAESDALLSLSELLRHPLVDARGRSARLSDLTVDLTVRDDPPVLALLFRQDGGLQAIDAGRVRLSDGRFRTDDLDAARNIGDEERQTSVLLARDVRDALLLDLGSRHASRANDLWLRNLDGRLVLAAADLSPGAVLRRVTRGALSFGRPDLVPWERAEFLRGDPRAARVAGDYHSRVADLPPAEIARLSSAVPYLHAAELLTLIRDDLATDVLEATSPERHVQVFEALDHDQARRLLALMAPDIAADLLGGLPAQHATQLLQELPADRRNLIGELLRYPPSTAGGLMTNSVVTVPAEWTVEEAIQRMDERLEGPDFVYYIYIVQDEESRRLIGVLSLRHLLIADRGKRLEDVMDPHLTALRPLDPAPEAAYRVVESHLLALPVVDVDGRLAGAVTFDAAMLEIGPASWREEGTRVFS